MSTTFTGQIRLNTRRIKDFDKVVEEIAKAAGFDGAVSHVDSIHYTHEVPNNFLPYHVIYLDGSATTNTRIETLLEALSKIKDVWGVMYASCDNSYGSYSFEFSETTHENTRHRLATVFLNEVIRNAGLSLQKSTIPNKTGLLQHLNWTGTNPPIGGAYVKVVGGK